MANVRVKVPAAPDTRKRIPAQRRLNSKSVTASAADITSALLADIESLLRRYLIFSSDHEPRLLALFVLFTYARDNDGASLFYAQPYLYINSKGSNHGKSRLIELLRLLVCRPTEHLHELTEAVIFRLIAVEKPVLFFDEIHRALSGPEANGIIGILNGGIFRDGMTARCDPRNPDGIIKYPIGCAKILAGRIDKGVNLPDETLSRSLLISLPHEPRASEKLGRRFNIEIAKQESAPVNAHCQAWANKHHAALASAGLPQYPNAINDRTAEAATGMLIIAELAGKTWTEYAHDALTAVMGMETEQILDGDTFDDWLKTAFERLFIAAGDYADRRKPPALCAARNVSASLFGWPAKRSFTDVSVKSDSVTDTLRIARDDFARFWKAVQRANMADSLPEPEKVLRDLRTAGRLTTGSPKGFTTKQKVWHIQAKQDATIVIDISHWYPAEPVTEDWSTE